MGMERIDAPGAVPLKAHKISKKEGIPFIKGFESFVPYVYDDKRAPVRGKYKMYRPGDKVLGTLTVLYGHTDVARHPLRIADCIGKTFTEDFGCEVLDVDLDECEDAVNRLVKVPITQGIFDALVSFTFNCGTGNLKKLIAPLNRGDYGRARSDLDHYVRSKGEFMRGLQRRRDGEQVLWDEGDINLPAEIVHHPAEVDTPVPAVPKLPNGKVAETVADLRPYSKKLQTVHWSQITSGGVSLYGFGQIFIDAVNHAKGVSDAISTVKADSGLVVLLLLGVVVFLGCALVKGWSWDDFIHGRWHPSGVAGDADDVGTGAPA